MSEIIPGPNRFDIFTIHCTSYKKIGNHEIEVGILIPKDLKPGLHPVFVKFHGGGCVSGTWSYPNWFANWFIPLIHRANAIVVSPNYRLLPEHNGYDIQEDLADFWAWFNNGGVTSYLRTQSDLDGTVELDYTRVLAAGDSAGGYLAIQSGLTLSKGTVRVILGCYPMTNYLRREKQDQFMGQSSPPPSIIDEHIANVKPGTVISASPPSPRNRISYALSAYGRYQEFFGTGADLWPITLLSSSSTRKLYLPPILILHGERDTAVPISDSRLFVQKAREVFGPGIEVKLVEREGSDHGFDMEISEEEDWVREVVGWIEERWVK